MYGKDVVQVELYTVGTTPTINTNYMLTDHLGSVDVVTDSSGVPVSSTGFSFDAFGQRREAATWAKYQTQAEVSGERSITHRGFTNHEMLDNVGLVHMNGRVYDPQTGRMVSADPTIPDPFYSQAFNRYAYVYNNPLNSTDPSGFDGDYAPVEFLQHTTIMNPDAIPCTCDSPFVFPPLGDPQPVDPLNSPVPTGTSVPLPAPPDPTTTETPPDNSGQSTNPKPAPMDQGTGSSANKYPYGKNIFGGAASCDCQVGTDAPTGASFCSQCHWEDASMDSLESIGTLAGMCGSCRESFPMPGVGRTSGGGKLRASIPHPLGSQAWTTGARIDTWGVIGTANAYAGANLSLGESSLVFRGFWTGSNGNMYQIGNYFGNQYGRTAAQTQGWAEGLRFAGKASVGAGLFVSGVQYFGHISAGNTAMAARDSIDPLMGAVGMEFPFGTGAAALWFTGEFIYDTGALPIAAQFMQQNEQIVPGYNSGPKW